MGQGKSKTENIIDSTTNVLLNVVNQSLQSCTSPVSQQQVSSIVQGDGSVIEGSKFNFKQAVNLDTRCVSSTNTENQLNTNLERTAQQQAKSINSSLGFLDGSTQAKNTTRYVTSIANSIKNAYTQECAAVVSQQQLNEIRQGNNSVIRTVDFNFDQTANAVVSCIQDNKTFNQAVTNLSEKVDQTATAENQGLFGGLSSLMTIGIIIFVIIILLVIIGLAIFLIKR